MIELIQITNDPAFARRCDAIGGLRLFVDLEWLGKAQRQAGRDTFISRHQLDDVARIREAARNSRLMVRVNPLNPRTPDELDAVLAQRPDLVMLPMFSGPRDLGEFARLVAGRAPIVPLLETAQALGSLEQWLGTPGVPEVYMGLNDLHLSLGLRFMFEPLASGDVDRVARRVLAHGLRFGFGGIARLDEGLLPGRDVLAEHLRVGSTCVILSRTFRRDRSESEFESDIAALREAEAALGARSAGQVEQDRLRIADRIAQIAAGMAQRQ